MKLCRYDAEQVASLNPYKLVVMTRDQDHHMAQIAATSPGAGELFDNIRGNFWFEYMPKDVNKSSGLAWLAGENPLSARVDPVRDYELWDSWPKIIMIVFSTP
jgi:hydroxymethylpyrimidine pyrophosphatase-like HAD family hydrolase